MATYDRGEVHRQSIYFGGLDLGDDLSLRLVNDVVVWVFEPGELDIQIRQRPLAERIRVQPTDKIQKVIARRSGYRPVARQLFARLEDLLGHDPCGRSSRTQSVEIC